MSRRLVDGQCPHITNQFASVDTEVESLARRKYQANCASERIRRNERESARKGGRRLYRTLMCAGMEMAPPSYLTEIANHSCH